VYIGQVWPVVEVRAIVKLAPAETAEIVGMVVVDGATQVGEVGKFDAKVSQVSWMRLFAVTAVVLIVYVAVVVGITTAPDDAEPQAAGDTELTAQLVALEKFFACRVVVTVTFPPKLAEVQVVVGLQVSACVPLVDPFSVREPAVPPAAPRESAVTQLAAEVLDACGTDPATALVAFVPPPAIGRPVALVRTSADGVPRAGVTRVGEVARTKLPVPVWFEVARAVPPPIATEVAVAAPRTGVTSVGEVDNTTLPVPVGVFARVNVTAPVEPELLMIVPSPLTDVTPPPPLLPPVPRLDTCTGLRTIVAVPEETVLPQIWKLVFPET
jgi:hypothetical protein